MIVIVLSQVIVKLSKKTQTTKKQVDFIKWFIHISLFTASTKMHIGLTKLPNNKG